MVKASTRNPSNASLLLMILSVGFVAAAIFLTLYGVFTSTPVETQAQRGKVIKVRTGAPTATPTASPRQR